MFIVFVVSPATLSAKISRLAQEKAVCKSLARSCLLNGDTDKTRPERQIIGQNDESCY